MPKSCRSWRAVFGAVLCADTPCGQAASITRANHAERVIQTSRGVCLFAAALNGDTLARTLSPFRNAWNAKAALQPRVPLAEAGVFRVSRRAGGARAGKSRSDSRRPP